MLLVVGFLIFLVVVVIVTIVLGFVIDTAVVVEADFVHDIVVVIIAVVAIYITFSQRNSCKINNSSHSNLISTCISYISMYIYSMNLYADLLSQFSNPLNPFHLPYSHISIIN